MLFKKRRELHFNNFIKIALFLFVIGLSVHTVNILCFKLPKKELHRVLILSRHNARTPLSMNLDKMTPQPWPKWRKPPGFLTDKGFLLEGYMGTYFSDWFSKENLLIGCPLKDDFFVYANALERTLASAQAFIEMGYPNCNIIIHHNVNGSDTIFNPYVHNSTIEFKKIALQEMRTILNQLSLNTSYLNMEHILNYEQSEFCKVENKCDMTKENNNLDVIVGKKPKISGPLKISNEAVDAFLMEYYDGLSMEDVAWGKIKNYEDWYSILNLSYSYHNVKYNTSHIALDIAKPMIKYISNIFLNKNYKITLLMGHDSNINVILNALSIKPFMLSDSFVNIPIGGKIVFQKWLDVATQKYLLKVDYVYQSTKQLREGIILSLKTPPLFKMLELNGCKINNEGFCQWDDFITILKSYE